MIPANHNRKDETMYARSICGRVEAGMMDEAVRVYRDEVLPVARQQRGFKAAYLLVDQESGKYQSITLWETENAMREGTETGYLRMQLAKIAATFDGPPTVDYYTVEAQG
jgi:heme-degrading monooxygenase HmoA